MQDISVKIGGSGYDLQDVIISGARSTKQAKEWAAARYPGCKIFSTQVVGGTSEERDYSDWGTCKGPRNPHGTKTVPDSTFVESNQGGSQSTTSNSSSGGSGCGVLLIGGMIIIGSIYSGISGVVEKFTTETAPAAPVTAVAPAAAPTPPAAAPVAPAATKTPCEIWADANPTLAARLVPGDTCYSL